MKTTVSNFSQLSGLVLVLTLGATSAPALAADMPALQPEPSDATASVPPATWNRTTPTSAGQYLKEVDAPRQRWSTLFDSDGRFAAQDATKGTVADASMPAHLAASTHGQSTMGHSMPAAATPALQSMAAGSAPAPMANTASDAQGEIKALYPDTGKVKIKHGAIARHDMPGMTMIFRVKDPALLAQVAPGDKIGFTMEIERGAMVITGFQKAEGAQ